MLENFKKFAMRGNVVDMAVGIVIGVAFGKIVSSFVKDISMPPIGLLMGNVDFSSLFFNLSAQTYSSLAEAQAAGAPTVNYGVFINSVLDFVIIAFAIFLVVMGMERLQSKPKEPAATPTIHSCPDCLSEIPIAATRCKYCTAKLA